MARTRHHYQAISAAKGLRCLLIAVTGFTGVFSVAQTANAADPSYSATYNQCMDASGGTTFGMIDCMTAESERWDNDLNAIYKTLMGSLEADQKATLKDAQRAWIKFRDANCTFYFDPHGGTYARVSANSCFLRMTAERTVELELFVQ